MLRFERTLSDGDDVTVNATDGIRLTILAGAGATVTVSRVDDESASSATGHGSDQTVSADTQLSIDVDWPFYYISTSGGSARVALV